MIFVRVRTLTEKVPLTCDDESVLDLTSNPNRSTFQVELTTWSKDLTVEEVDGLGAVSHAGSAVVRCWSMARPEHRTIEGIVEEVTACNVAPLRHEETNVTSRVEAWPTER